MNLVTWEPVGTQCYQDGEKPLCNVCEAIFEDLDREVCPSREQPREDKVKRPSTNDSDSERTEAQYLHTGARMPLTASYRTDTLSARSPDYALSLKAKTADRKLSSSPLDS